MVVKLVDIILIDIGINNPNINSISLFFVIFSFLISIDIIGKLPIIKPANKAVIENGKILIICFINIKPKMNPIIVPINIGNKKKIDSLNFLKRLLIEFSILSYKLNNIDIVEPLIPGTTIAIPIKKPKIILLNKLRFNLSSPSYSINIIPKVPNKVGIPIKQPYFIKSIKPNLTS